MLVGISGKIGSGKDTLARFINAELFKSMGGYADVYKSVPKQYRIVRFADVLKSILCLLTGCTCEQLEDQAFKKQLLPDEWAIPEYDQRWNMYTHREITYREALQKIGTELFREQFHPNTWVNATMKDYKPYVVMRDAHYLGESIHAGMIKDKQEVWPNWIIPDVRFPNEVNAILEAGGILIRMERVVTKVDKHLSETALDNYNKFDYICDNNGSLDDLKSHAEYIIKHFKLIEYADTNTRPTGE